MRFADLFAGHVAEPLALEVSGVCRDSRLLRPGEVYVAMGPAHEQPGHIAEAIARGAVAVVVEGGIPGLAGVIPLLITPNARAAYSCASAMAHGLDRRCPALLAMVGTAGKSTTTHCAWWALGSGAARIGTIGWHDGNTERANPQTTPPPEQMHAFLAGLPATCPGVAMEVSSHACDQSRCEGLSFAALVFTGIGHDHLDYHHTMEAYVAAKLSAFRWLKPGGLAILNAEDARYDLLAAAAHAAKAQVISLGFTKGNARLSSSGTGWSLTLDGNIWALPVRLPGDFNAWNTAAGALAATALGISLDLALTRLANLPPVPGRLELLAQKPDTFVDYAHTPDELIIMLSALRRQCSGRKLVCVFGCGGDRDRSKRGPMGRAALLADVAILTTDNSRSEDPRAIADEVLAGVPLDDRPRLITELDRAAAIRLARTCAGPDGIAVISGKGHETDQIIQGRTLPWDDRAFVRSLASGSAP